MSPEGGSREGRGGAGLMVVGPACFPGAGPRASGPQSKVSTGCQPLPHCTEDELSPERSGKLEEDH